MTGCALKLSWAERQAVPTVLEWSRGGKLSAWRAGERCKRPVCFSHHRSWLLPRAVPAHALRGVCQLALATLHAKQALTSQIALPREIASTVYARAAGYDSSVRRLSRITTRNDNVFRDNSAAQITAMTPAMSGSIAAGFIGNLVIGVAV